VESGNGSDQRIALAAGSTSINLPDRPTTAQLCYRLQKLNPCNNELLTSRAACILPASAVAVESQNVISWQSYPAAGIAATYRLLRSEAGGAFTEVYSGRDVFYIDTNVSCLTNYCYRLEALFGSTLLSRSAPACVEAKGGPAPPAIPQALAEYNADNELEIRWNYPTGRNDVKMQLSLAGGATEVVEGTVFTGPEAQVPQPALCYQLSLQDQCLQQGDSLTLCPVSLNGNLLPDSRAFLNFTTYEGSPVSSYRVEVFSPDGDILQEEIISDTLYWEQPLLDHDFAELGFRVVAQLADGRQSSSNTLYLEQPIIFIVPEAFTPNNDGLNDQLEVISRGLRDFKIQIYNRLGGLISTSTDKNNAWDGTIEATATAAPQGVYAYVIEATDVEGNSRTQKGMFMLMR
jgi:gliding motility-associated-like protein